MILDEILDKTEDFEALQHLDCTCEVDGCDSNRKMYQMHSYTLCVNILDITNKTYGSYSCSHSNHFGCCAGCAINCAHMCIDQCIDAHIEEPTQPVPFTDMATFVTQHSTNGCAICHQALADRVYWIPVSYATPGAGYVAFSCQALHFCCSLEHAKTAAKACIDEHLKQGSFEGKETKEDGHSNKTGDLPG